MEGRLQELTHLLNQALQEKQFLQSEVKRLAFDNMGLYEEKEKKTQIDPADIQEIHMKAFFYFIIIW